MLVSRSSLCTNSNVNLVRPQNHQSRFTRLLLAVVLPAMVLMGSVTAQAAVTKLVGGMLFSGTAPFDGSGAGHDASATDNIIRTHDTAAYRVGYTISPQDTGGVLTLTMGASTLPGSYVGPAAPQIAYFSALDLPTGAGGCQNISATALSAAQIAAGTTSGVSADGQTLVCVQPSPTSGATQDFMMRVAGSAPNGATVAAPTVTYKSLTNPATSALTVENDGATYFGMSNLTVSAAPRWNLAKNTYPPPQFVPGSGPAGENGYVISYNLGVFAQGSRKGLEALNGAYTISEDFSSAGKFPNSRLLTWSINSPGYLVLDYSAAGQNGCADWRAANANIDNAYAIVGDYGMTPNSTVNWVVARGGTCDQTAFNNTTKTATLTLNNTDFSLNFYPTKMGYAAIAATLVNPINQNDSTNQWWVASKAVVLWAPLTDMPPMPPAPSTQDLTNRATLAGTSVTGQANTEPTLADNQAVRTAVYNVGSAFMSKSYNPFLANNPFGLDVAQADPVSADGRVNQASPGQVLSASVRVFNTDLGSLGAGYICDKIDNARFTFFDITSNSYTSNAGFVKDPLTGVAMRTFSGPPVNYVYSLGIGGAGSAGGTWSSFNTVASEYSYPATTGSAQSDSDCADPSITWYPSVASLLSAGHTLKEVSRVRADYTTFPGPADNMALLIPLQVNATYSYSGTDNAPGGAFTAGASTANAIAPNQAMWQTNTARFATPVPRISEALKIVSNEYIQISKTSSSHPAAGSLVGVGNTITYALTVNATTSTNAHTTTIDVWDVLPNYVSYVAGSSTMGGAALPDPTCAVSGLPVALFPTQPLTGGVTACHWTLTNQAVAKATIGNAAGNLPVIKFNTTVAVAAPSATVLNNTSFADSTGNNKQDAVYNMVNGFQCVSGQNCSFSNWLLNVSATPGLLLSKQVSKSLLPLNGSFSYTYNYGAIGNDLSNARILDVLPYVGDGRVPASAYTGTIKFSAPLALPVAGGFATMGDANAQILYTSNAPANISRDSSSATHILTGLGSNGAGSTNWCTVAQFGTANCPATIADATAFLVIPHHNNGDANLDKLTAGDTYSLIAQVTTTGGNPGDLFANDFTGDSNTLLAHNPTSNVVSTKITAPDLILTKTVLPATGLSGSTSVYTITVKNNTGTNVGPIEAIAGTVIKMTDTLTGGNISISGPADVSGTNWDCSASTAPSTISCTYTGALPLGVGATVGGPITITVLLGAAVPTGTVVTNTANTAMTGPQVELPNTNNSGTVAFTATHPGVIVSGNVYNDTNGLLGDNFVNGPGTQAVAGGTLTAYLVNNLNKVVNYSDVAANGSYGFTHVPIATGYHVVLSNTAGTAASINATAPIASLPAGWVNTGEVNGDSTTAHTELGANIADGLSANFDINGAADIVNINFGIEQPPTTGTATYVSQPNPTGTNTVAVGAGAFVGTLPVGVTGGNASDPDATVTHIKITAFPSNTTSITINGVSYTSGTFPVGGVTVTVAQLAGMLLDPVDGLITASIPYVAIDAAGKVSAAAGAVNLPFAGVSVSGSVYNDTNGLTDNLVNDGTGTNAGSGTLTAYLIDGSNTIVASSLIAVNGAYSMGNVPAGSGYRILLSNTAGLTGTLASSSLPAGWVSTGESNGAGAGSDGTPDGISAAFTIGATNVTDRNFGIEQPPTAGTATYASQVNPGGTVTLPVDAGAFVGTLPTTATGSNATDATAVTQIKVTAFPSNVTSITINVTTYTAGTFPGTGVTVTVAQLAGMRIDTVDGAVTVDIPYIAIDAADKESPTPGHVLLPFTQLNLSGFVFSDINGNKLKEGAETGDAAFAGINVVLTNAAGTVVIASQPVNAATGAYSLPISPNTNYQALVTTSTVTIGSAPPVINLPSAWVKTGESTGGAVETPDVPDSTQVAQVLTSSLTNVNFGLAQVASLSGIVWRDLNHDRALTGGEPGVPNFVVEVLNASGVVVKNTFTDVNGAYSVNGLTPGVPYSVRFRDPATSNIILGVPTYNHNMTGTTLGTSTTTASGTSTIDATGGKLNVTLIAGTNLVHQSLPLDPNGVVYDAVTRNPIQGATVTLLSNGNPVNPLCLVAGVNPQITGPDGYYEYLLINPAPVVVPACPGTANYTINVIPAAGYLPPNALQGGVALPGGLPALNLGAINLIQAQATAPTGAQSTQYSFNFQIVLSGLPATSTGDIVNNHIPLDPAVTPTIFVSKIGNKSIAEIGDTVMYTIKAKLSNGVLASAQLVDNLPAGFKYIPGTATIAKGAVATTIALANPLPVGNLGPQLTFVIGTMNAADTVTVTYKVRVGVGAMQGDGINRVYAHAIGGGVSNTAQFRVKVTGGVFTNDACVAGKVFVDCNNNHIQDPEELGVPGVRLYMEDGTYFITDVEGKYSYCGISPRTHVLKADNATLPRGSRLTTTSNRNAGDANSLFLDVKNGELIRGDFAEGSCSNTVLEQVKARRGQGEVRAPETERKGGPALKFEGKSPNYPQQGTDSANQPIVKPRGGGGDATVTETVNNQPVSSLPDASGNSRGNYLRDVKEGEHAN
ncbi:MAG: SdrD B-like domain-containing protein [Methylotenera sp.]|nr:SdrD B-like domain-containing protein [Methylotenera sp.]MDP2281787.1 SdrD B-like domain-containing protein [Methylotenera sp.]MDP3059323.1 SdrD B-like domain-containing protein [Methylotenera sp.]